MTTISHHSNSSPLLLGLGITTKLLNICMASALCWLAFSTMSPASWHIYLWPGPGSSSPNIQAYWQPLQPYKVPSNPCSSLWSYPWDNRKHFFLFSKVHVDLWSGALAASQHRAPFKCNKSPNLNSLDDRKYVVSTGAALSSSLAWPLGRENPWWCVENPGVQTAPQNKWIQISGRGGEHPGGGILQAPEVIWMRRRGWEPGTQHILICPYFNKPVSSKDVTL